MSAVRRIGAVVHADVLIRMRRPSTVVVFLLLSWLAWIWVPDPATGRTLMQVDGRRVIYNSAAVATGSASLATLFIGLVGYYVVSNALRRDLVTRCGFIVASTTVRSGEYLLAKFFGNLAFLALFATGYMLVAMAMLLVRGEAALEPIVFAGHYLFIVGPVLVAVAAIALLFESVPWLSGRFGDFVYFFLWIALLGMGAAAMRSGKGDWTAALLDVSGLGILFEELREALATDAVGVGTMTFDPAKPPFVFDGLRLSSRDIGLRVISAAGALALLPVAWLFFRRFDPAKVRIRTGGGALRLLSKAGRMLKPLARPLHALSVGRRGSIAAAAANDALLTLELYPVILLAAAGFAIAALVSPDAAALRSGVLPIAFAAVAVFLSDLASRETRSGTLGMLFSTPGLRERFAVWKLTTAFLLGAVVLVGPLVRLALTAPTSLPETLAGLLFTAAAATLLGVVSRNPKTMIVLFLVFWYVVVNDGGQSPALDFAGFYGEVDLARAAMYGAVGAGMATLAATAHAARLRRAAPP